MKNHETNLPENYQEVYHINALDKKFGLIFNIIALGVLALVAAVAFIPYFVGAKSVQYDYVSSLISMGALFVGMLAYIILHELTHGVAYKALTGEKLTYGFGWSCAYCGVPNIYVYRRASLIALLSPFILFTLILLPITIWMYFVGFEAYLVAVILLGMHLGGCSGDLYMTLLLIFKFKNNELLVRDTGPEQFLYLPKGE